MEKFLTPEDAHLVAINEAFSEAAKILELADCPDFLDDEEMEMIFESRHHCGTCMVRTVMDVVWPEIEKYVAYVKYGSN